MIEVFPSGAAVWQVSPVAPGSCRITVSVLAPSEFSREGAALFYLALRYATQRIEDEIAVAESTEIGLRSAFTGDAIVMDERDPVVQFRRWIAESVD
jgi:phenylpropionate dioxygenase-like ring-hydroxylating dioxygenase large terminal subunit